MVEYDLRRKGEQVAGGRVRQENMQVKGISPA
jgi:hypothetical protein